MLEKIKEIITKRNQLDSKGMTLIEVVVAMTLFIAVGGSFVFATTVLMNAKTVNAEMSKDAISITGVTNSFKSDINNARKYRINSDPLFKSIDIAKSDGSCVTWTVTNETEANLANGKVTRTTYTGNLSSAQKIYSLQENVVYGDITEGKKSVTMSFNYGKNSKNLELNERILVSGNSLAGCW